MSMFGNAGNLTCAGSLEDAIPNAYRSPLFVLFFSRENVETLHAAIRYEVFRTSGGRYTIGRQSETELSIIMRNVYRDDARHLPGDVRGQVRDLNRSVVRLSASRILPEVEHWEKYTASLGEIPVNTLTPVASSSRGEKSEAEIFRMLPPT